MSNYKNPQNRNSLPSVIISNFDNQNIYELKIKYEKLARLDRIAIKQMRFDTQQKIIFEAIEFNGETQTPQNQEIHINLENKEYIITAQRVHNPNKYILTKEGKSYNVIKKDGKYYKNGKEFMLEGGSRTPNSCQIYCNHSR